jgi:MarR family transcriptional regulator, lower aerobic nicotinate degradation pathway regulator
MNKRITNYSLDQELNSLPHRILFDVAKVTIERVETALRTAKLTHRHYWILLALDQGEGANQVELAGAIGVNRNAMVDLLDVLEQQNLVCRKRNPSNRREHIVVSTEVGKELVGKLKAQVQQAETSVTAALTMNERETLFSLLDRLRTPPRAA